MRDGNRSPNPATRRSEPIIFEPKKGYFQQGFEFGCGFLLGAALMSIPVGIAGAFLWFMMLAAFGYIE